MVKKFFSILAMILCVALAVSCSAAPGPETADPPDSDVAEPAAPSINGSVYTGDSVADSPFVGRFINTYSAQFASLSKQVFEDEAHTPVLICGADGKFELSVNFMDSGPMRAITGSFTVNGDIAVFEVNGGGPGFTMTLIDQNSMRYAGEEQGCVTRGDIFERIDY